MDNVHVTPTGVPWKRGVAAARQLRNMAGNVSGPIKDSELYEFLGLTNTAVDAWSAPGVRFVSIAKPDERGTMNFIPRKSHPLARRFEFARILGDVVTRPEHNRGWLVSSDISTARQKLQRAFAAELLCPIDALLEFLNDDHSESSREEAASHFNVSELTISSLLNNNGYGSGADTESKIPYRLAA